MLEPLIEWPMENKTQDTGGPGEAVLQALPFPPGRPSGFLGNDLPFLWSLLMPAAWREGQETDAPGEHVQLSAEDEKSLSVLGRFSETQKETCTLQPWRKVHFIF